MTDIQYVYPARLEEVIDGDTIDVTVDLGFHITRRVRLRLAGLDTAEIYGVEDESAEYERGMVHSNYVSEWFDETPDEAFPLTVDVQKKGKFGRYIATVYRNDRERSLNDALRASFDVASES